MFTVIFTLMCDNLPSKHVGVMLDNRLRHWPDIKPVSDGFLVFSGYSFVVMQKLSEIDIPYQRAPNVPYKKLCKIVELSAADVFTCHNNPELSRQSSGSLIYPDQR